ncbi:MAG TPA: ComEC/Rec2 family competence protein [Candidatus Omnitrophota bacterium]|nr:ComEC/Rec2 family competence protein [Candidatus Omnitrophota bacterium]
MKMPFLWVAFGFMLGIIIEKYLNFPVLGILSGHGVGILILCGLRGRKMFLPVFLLCMGCMGMLASRAENYVPSRAIQNHIGPNRVTVTGIVDSLPEVKTRGKKVSVSFVLAARSVTKWEKRHRHKFWVTGSLQTFLLQPPWIPKVGDELRLFGTLQAPRRVSNPGEFDYAKYLKTQNIDAIFQTIGKKSVQKIREGWKYSPMRLLAQARRFLADLIDKRYAASDAAILKALVIGLRSEVAPDVRDHFMKTGTVHILAISGLNITMIAGSFYLILLILKLNHKKAAALTIVVVGLYVVLAGAGLPVQRAGYGSSLVLLGVLLGRPGNLLNALCFAFFAMLLWNPSSLWNIGFQLSFLSVLSLMVVLPLTARLNFGSLSIGSSFAVLLGTFPFVLYYFNIFSPVSIIANLLAIPLFDAVLFMALFSLLLSWIPILNAILIKITSMLLCFGLSWVKYLSVWQWGYWFFERPSLMQMVFYYTALAALLGLRPRSVSHKHWFVTGVSLVLIAVTASFFWPKDAGGFQMTLLSSGKNQIMHVRFSRGSHWLINTGRSFPSDQGEWFVAPYLRNLGIRRLEGVVLTDLSKSNTGGLRAVIRDFPIQGLFYPEHDARTSQELFRVFRLSKGEVRNLQAGDVLGRPDEKMRVLAEGRHGMAVLIMLGRWRILVISKVSSSLFETLLKSENMPEIHAVILPSLRGEAPEECLQWIEKSQPRLVISSDEEPDLKAYLSLKRIFHLNLKKTGAIAFKKKSSYLELESFLMGKLGFYSYL